MGRLRQFGAPGARQSKWLRLLGLLCLVVICVASTAQVCHTHGDLAPFEKNSHQNAPAPDHCPLCVAMHSALPATFESTHGAVTTAQRLTAGPAAKWLGRIRVSDLQTRPPPAA